MKKLAIVLSLSFLLPVVAPAISHGAANYSDLAVGDPMGGSYRRTKRKPAAKSTAPAADKTAPAAEKAPAKPAEKPAEPAK